MAYHHVDFHPVPARPPLAAPGIGPFGPMPVGVDGSEPVTPLPQIPNQKIEIVPPPPPEESPKRLPAIQSSDDLMTGLAGEASGRRSWIFAATELGRRVPAAVEVRRPDYSSPRMRVRR